MRDRTVEMLDRVFRAGELVQAIFYAIAEHTWAYDISNIRVVRDDNGTLIRVEVIHGSGSKTDSQGDSVCAQVASGWLYKFPHESFKLADLYAKRALLSDQNSVWAFVLMHNVVQLLFGDLVNNPQTDIKEVVHYLSSDVQHIVQHSNLTGTQCIRADLPYPDKDASGNVKGVYRIKLSDGTKIALDLTGMQYNVSHVTVMPWSIYRKHWPCIIKYSLPFRSHHEKHAENASKSSTVTHLSIIKKQMESANTLLNESDQVLGFDFKTMLLQDVEIFLDAKQRLLLAVSNRLAEYPHDIDGPSELVVDTFDRTHDYKTMTNTSISEPLLFHFGEMSKFRWSNLLDIVKIIGPEVAYKEKKQAKELLRHRCVYRMPGNWRLIFLYDEMPSPQVPGEFVSENPYWLKRRQG